MAKEEWGTKRMCPETGKRFYDLNNSPVISPYTGKELILDKSSSEKTKVTRKREENINDAKFEESEDLITIEDDNSFAISSARFLSFSIILILKSLKFSSSIFAKFKPILPPPIISTFFEIFSS